MNTTQPSRPRRSGPTTPTPPRRRPNPFTAFVDHHDAARTPPPERPDLTEAGIGLDCRAAARRTSEAGAGAGDAAEVELRRIERDLHDGAQARLAAVAIHLGVAADLFDTDPDTARAMLAHARAAARTAQAELRNLVRGILPPLLADGGLAGALAALARDSPVPVELALHLTRRLPPPMEAAAYFALAEAVTNAIKHSGAARIVLTVADRECSLLLRVVDDGCGGADPARGTGLHGIARRLAAFAGRLHITSPAGGPTTVEAELPWACPPHPD